LIAVDVLKHQAEFLQASERFVCLTGGFGCGKSFGIGLKAWNLARINAGFDGMLVSRTATQLRKLCSEVETVFNKMGVKWRRRGTDEYLLDFGTKEPTTIYLGTTENYAYEKWAGGNLAWVVIDEIDTMPHAEEVWKFANDRVRVMAPLLQTACASTPEGYGFLWNFFENQVAQDKSLAPSRRLIRGCTFDNPYIDADYVRSQIQTRDPRTLRAYVYGAFVNLEGHPCYYRYDKDICRTRLTLDDARFAQSIIRVGYDFNKNINAATLNVVQDNIIYALDEIFGLTDTREVISEIRKRAKGRQVHIYPDASGFEGIQTLKDAFGEDRVHHPKKNPPVQRRVTAVNKRLVSDAGAPLTLVNQERCPNLHAGLLRQTKDKNGDPDKTSGLDHSMDGFGYFVWHFWPQNGDGTFKEAHLGT
jgi:hypothetical protein